MSYLEKMFPVAIPNSEAEQYLIISGHDYRSKRKANLHFIAEELRQRGRLRWFSPGFSPLSNLKKRDPRIGLEKNANLIETVDGVDCYLWRTPIHPFKVSNPVLNSAGRLAFPLYVAVAPSVFDQWVSEAQTIVVESGISVAFIQRIRRFNPTARVIYVASDDLETIGADQFLIEELERVGPLLNGVRVTSPLLRNVMPSKADAYFVPHGIDRSIKNFVGENPYAPGTINAVSVGSMLFDPSFFEVAGRRFPDVRFHVIGSGYTPSVSSLNVKYYPEMKYQDTINYIAHANFGIAPYRQANAPYYLSDTSMKIMQYEFFALNAVCPEFVALDKAGRFGYRPGAEDSIVAAIQGALDSARIEGAAERMLSWSQVVDRLLDPNSYPDTHLTS